jgi:hypothetical protein
MPVVRLGQHSGTRFDIVGSCDGGTSAVTHVGMLAAAVQLTAGASVTVLQMSRRPQLDPPSGMDAHVVAALPLTRDEAAALEEWIEGIRTIISRCSYFASPAATADRDPETQIVRGWKFSCAGFVVTAYKAADIHLVVDESEIPPLEFDKVILAWSHIMGDRTENAQRQLLSAFGLKGTGPWRVLLPGYLLHACKDGSTRPYSPGPEDISFP